MTERPAWMQPRGRPWGRLSETLVYENPWIRVTEHQAVAPTGRPAVYGVVGFKNLALGVLPLHEDGTVTLVGQHRFALEGYSWEMPEGGGPLGVDPLESARRELAEEAGLVAREWRKVLDLQLSNSITDERGICYLATGLSPVATAPDETEEIAIARIPFREALGLALSGAMPDVMTVAMLLAAYHMAHEGELARDLTEAMLR